jgi:superoxide dismutase
MKKKLPSVFVNKIEKKLDNNNKIFYSVLEYRNSLEPTKEHEIISGNIKDKINELFNSVNYVYKMNVTLTLKDKQIVNKDIIGQLDNKLITIDDELINIEDITDIKY